MDIDQLLVRFLRFLNFSEIANNFNGATDRTRLHPLLLNAAQTILNRTEYTPGFFYREPNLNIIFQRVAEQFELLNLTNAFVARENNLRFAQ